MQLVVVMAVRKAVSAATTTFTAISMILFFIRYSVRMLAGVGVTHGDWHAVCYFQWHIDACPLCVTSMA